MEKRKIISIKNEKDLLNQLKADLKKGDEIFEYRAEIKQEGKKIFLDIDIDLGGGFEGGYAFTSLGSPLRKAKYFRFAIHEENLIRDIGKLFGMQDIKIGYPAFDKQFVIKSNDEARTKKIFSDRSARAILISLQYFTLKISHYKTGKNKIKIPFLELTIDGSVTEPLRLVKTYKAFYSVLSQIER